MKDTAIFVLIAWNDKGASCRKFWGRLRWNALSSTRWESNAALPPDICAFGESFYHRLEDKPIHLGLVQLQLPFIVASQ
jgi:hypothetical protein